MVGIKITSLSTYPITPGLQDPTAIGFRYKPGTTNQEFPSVAVTPFADSTYAGVERNDYHGSLAEKYINEYVDKLKNMGANLEVADEFNNKGTLITKQEISDLVNDGKSYSLGFVLPNTYPWLTTTSYWTKTKDDLSSVWIVTSFGTSGTCTYNGWQRYGIRPVIVLNQNEI